MLHKVWYPSNGSHEFNFFFLLQLPKSPDPESDADLDATTLLKVQMVQIPTQQ